METRPTRYHLGCRGLPAPHPPAWALRCHLETGSPAGIVLSVGTGSPVAQLPVALERLQYAAG